MCTYSYYRTPYTMTYTINSFHFPSILPHCFALAKNPCDQSFYVSAHRRIFRIMCDGTQDDSFCCETIGNVMSIYPMNDKTILIAGNIVNVNGKDCSNIAKLNYDGSICHEFNCQINNIVNTIDKNIYDHTKVFVGGCFTSINNISANYVANICAITGALDTEFTSSLVTDTDLPEVYGISRIQQYNDKIFLGGRVTTTTDYYSLCSLLCLNSNGSINRDFHASNDMGHQIDYLCIDDLNSKIYVVGYNSTYDSKLGIFSMDGILLSEDYAFKEINSLFKHEDSIYICGKIRDKDTSSYNCMRISCKDEVMHKHHNLCMNTDGSIETCIAAPGVFILIHKLNTELKIVCCRDLEKLAFTRRSFAIHARRQLFAR